MKKLLALIMLLCMVAAAAGFSSGTKDDPAKTTPVSLGMLRLTSSAPLFIAIEKGYLDRKSVV